MNKVENSRFFDGVLCIDFVNPTVVSFTTYYDNITLGIHQLTPTDLTLLRDVIDEEIKRLKEAEVKGDVRR